MVAQEQLTLDMAFNDAVNEDFWPGMESRFSRRLDVLLIGRGESVLPLIFERILSQQSDDLACEALRWIARTGRLQKHNYAIQYLQQALKAPSADLRYVAADELVTSIEKKALEYLEPALALESDPWLREAYQGLISSLR